MTLACYCRGCDGKYVCWEKMKNYVPVEAHVDHSSCQLVFVCLFVFLITEMPCDPTALRAEGAQSRHSLFAVPTVQTAALLLKSMIFGGSNTNITDSPLLVNGGSRAAEGLFLCRSTFTNTFSSKQFHPALSFGFAEQLKLGSTSESRA